MNGFVSASTQVGFEIEPFITCSSTGVVYLLQCPCGFKYVGKTKCALQVCLNEHINNIRKGFRHHSVSKHYAAHHYRDPINTIFLGIDKFKAHWRGSSMVGDLYKMEMSWIHKIRSYVPNGLNVDVDAFIDSSEFVIWL